jgi:hypothetical protein
VQGVSRYQVALLRGAVVYLLATAAFGVLFTLRPGLVGLFGPTHAHLGLVGFFLSTVMGVAFWMMPRPGGIRQEGWEAACFYLLNAGLVLRAVAEPWWRASQARLPHDLFVASGALTLAAVVAFAWAMRRRIVTKDEIRARSRGRRSPS